MIKTVGYNNLENLFQLVGLVGEEVQAVFTTPWRSCEDPSVVIVFRSGYALQWSLGSGAFRLLHPLDAENMLYGRREELKAARARLARELAAVGEGGEGCA